MNVTRYFHRIVNTNFVYLLIPIILISCKDDSIDPDENGFLDQVAQGRIDDEIWVHEDGFAQVYTDEYSTGTPELLVVLTMNNSSHDCQKDNVKEFYIHFVIENELGMRDLEIEIGPRITMQVGIIGATDKTQATTLLNIGKIDITSISSDSITGRIHGSNTTFTDTFVNGNFSVPICEDPS